MHAALQDTNVARVSENWYRRDALCDPCCVFSTTRQTGALCQNSESGCYVTLVTLWIVYLLLPREPSLTTFSNSHLTWLGPVHHKHRL